MLPMSVHCCTFVLVVSIECHCTLQCDGEGLRDAAGDDSAGLGFFLRQRALILRFCRVTASLLLQPMLPHSSGSTATM